MNIVNKGIELVLIKQNDTVDENRQKNKGYDCTNN